jgi:hypothetical protein
MQMIRHFSLLTAILGWNIRGFRATSRDRRGPNDGRAERTLRRQLPRHAVLHGVALGLGGFLAANACYPPERQRISCDDLLPPQEASFTRLTTLVFDDLKGCSATACHGVATQKAGLRLDEPNLIYEEFTSRSEVIYSMVSSGEMPDGGVRWDDADLRLFRSWYCAGAFPP